MQGTVLNFDATTVDPNYSPGEGFLPVSDERGWLVILNEDRGLKPASSGKGQYLELAGVCQEGPHAGKPFSMRFNIYHESPGTVTAAYAQLSAIGHCVGVLRIGTAADLFNKPFRVVSELQDPSKPDGYTQLARKNGIRDANGNPPNAGNGGQAQGGAPQTQPQMNNPTQPQPQPQPQGGQMTAQGNWQGQGQAGPNAGQNQPQQGQGGAPNWAQGQGGANMPTQPQPQQGQQMQTGQQQVSDSWQTGGQAQGGAPSWAQG